jgi:tripartite-type tricarboxylate transporter receptor subunit TctC
MHAFKPLNVPATLAAALCAVLALPAAAQNWPTKPIRVIIPYPAGGTSDILARMIGPELTKAWGPQVIVDNRVGANGAIAMEITARSPADGNTSVLNDLGNVVISPAMYSKLPFDIIRDFTPIAMISYSAHVLATHPSVPAKNVQELIAIAKASPGKLNVPVGLGAAVHVAALSLEQRAGVKWVYVPTKGGQASIMTVATGEGDLLFMGMLQTMPHVRAGRLKLIAVSSEKRDPNLPNVPTVQETPGLSGFVTGSYQGLLGPAKMPADVLNKFNAEVNRVITSPEIKEKLAAHGTVPLPMTPQELGKWLITERDRWGKVVKASGFKID